MSSSESCLDLRPDHLTLVQDILRKHVPDRKVLAFGSRATWTAKEYSDLDLAILGEEPLSLHTISPLAEEFIESDLPFKVDIVDWARVDEPFRNIIHREGVVVQLATRNSDTIDTLSDDWQTKTLGDVVTFINGDRSKNYPKQTDYADEGIPFISASELNDSTLLESSIYPKRIPIEVFSRLRSGKIQSDDILLCLRGSLGKIGVVRENFKGAIASSLVILRSGQKVDSRFVFYYLKSSVFQQMLRSYDNGSVQGNLSVKNVSSIFFPGFNLPDQKSIAHILGTLDDKIELNQKMNQTLEEIAQAIFKSWFVNFDPVRAKAEGRPTGLPPEISDLFPDELVESEIGDIPEGWEIKTTEEICAKIAMGPFGSNIKVSTFVDQGVPIISGHHLHGLLIKESKYKYVSEEHAERLKNSIVMSGDVIFTHAGTVGQVSLIPKSSEHTKYVISQRQFYARPLFSSLSSYLTLYFHSPIGQHKLLSNVSGSGVPSIARPSSHLKGIELVLPPKSVIETFSEIADLIVDRMVNIALENKVLAELRDTLLPKLISGKLRIPDAEKFLVEAGV